MTPYLNRLFVPYPTLHTWRPHQTGILLGYRGRLCITPPHTLHAQRRFMRYRVPFGYWAYVTSCSQRVRLSTSRLLHIVLLCECIPCLHHYRPYIPHFRFSAVIEGLYVIGVHLYNYPDLAGYARYPLRQHTLFDTHLGLVNTPI